MGRTPLVPSPSLSERLGSPVYLKLENQQITGSFKLRGALSAVTALGETQRRRGVITVSTGNHGRAVAHACRLLGIRAVVCLSELVPENKREAIEALGAQLLIKGRGQDEAQVEAERLMEREGLSFIPPFDHPEVIAGQGTIGLEIVEQLSDLSSVAGQASSGAEQPDSVNGSRKLRVLVPLSGGGLIAGIALALDALDPESTIVGVSSRNCCAMYRSLEAGEAVEVEELKSLADSLGGGIGRQNRYTLAMVRELVGEHVLVDEEDLARAIVHAYASERQVLEGAGAAGIAALLSGATAGTGAIESDPNTDTVIVLSGGNIDTGEHFHLLAQALPGTDATDGSGQPAGKGSNGLHA